MLQLVADGVKFIERIFSPTRRTAVFAIAPLVVVLSTFLLFVVVPAPTCSWRTSTPASSSPSRSRAVVVGILMARLGVANKYSPHGWPAPPASSSLPTSCLVLAVVGVVIQAGALNLRDRRRPGQRLDLRRGLREPVHPHPVRRLRHLPDRGRPS